MNHTTVVANDSFVDTASNDFTSNDNNHDVTVLGCDRYPLHYACRTGHYKQVQYLLDILGYDSTTKINEPDDHNATPLYHAALVGNTNICLLLLHRGAICNEHDSARVFYVALTPTLRTLLREWSLSAATIDPYLQSLHHNFTSFNNIYDNSNSGISNNKYEATSTIPQASADGNTEGTNIDTTDCTIQIWIVTDNASNSDQQNSTVKTPPKMYRSVSIHRIMLQYRCPYLLDQIIDLDTTESSDIEHLVSKNVLSEQNQRSTINLYAPDSLQCDIFYRIIEYLYSGKIEILSYKSAVLCAKTIQRLRLQHHNELHTKLQSVIDEYQARIAKQNGSLKNQEQQKLQQQNRITGDENIMNGNYNNEQVGEIAISYMDQQASANPFVLASLLVPDSDDDANERKNQSTHHDTTAKSKTDTSSDPNAVGTFRTCTISDIDQLRSDMKQLALVVSSPLSLSQQQEQKHGMQDSYTFSDLTIICNADLYCVHRFRLIQQSDYFLCALKGNFIEASKSQLDLTSLLSTNANILPYLLQWNYADCFLHPLGVSISVAMEIIHLSMALLCSTRLVSYVVNTIIIPNLSLDNVFDIIDFTRTYLPLLGNNTIVDRLECKCCEILATHIDEIFNMPDEGEKATTKYEDEIRYIVDTEIKMTRQGGDVNNLDIPFIAEIRRAINRLVGIPRNERNSKLELLLHFVNKIKLELQQEQGPGEDQIPRS